MRRFLSATLRKIACFVEWLSSWHLFVRRNSLDVFRHELLTEGSLVNLLGRPPASLTVASSSGHSSLDLCQHSAACVK